MMLLAGAALAEPQKAAPPCPKVDFTAADVVRGCAWRARFSPVEQPRQHITAHDAQLT